MTGSPVSLLIFKIPGVFPHRQVDQVNTLVRQQACGARDTRRRLAMPLTGRVGPAVLTEGAVVAAKRREIDEPVEEHPVVEVLLPEPACGCKKPPHPHRVGLREQETDIVAAEPPALAGAFQYPVVTGSAAAGRAVRPLAAF
jgi:hypothetical protein